MKKKVLFISLGCDKNLVDTEMMLGQLSKHDYVFTDDENEADVVVVNTCCFIGDAKEESIATILEMAELKKNNVIEALIVAGCLGQRYQEEVQTEIPEVDAILGTASIDKIVEALDGIYQKKACNYFTELSAKPYQGTDRILTTGGHYAYLKIAEGCNKHCTYCIIPKVRGNYRSVPMEQLIEDATKLAQMGVKELILVAQETTLYGLDLYGKKSLPELLHKLAEISGIYWIRILYCYPEEIDHELIQAMKSEEKVCHYLDLPIQHASDHILGRMGRKTSEEELFQKIEMLREEIPDICLRTTLISGFPGETQEDFEELYRFVDAVEFDRLGVFTYSQEEDTPAALMEDQIPEEVKEKRREELMLLQQEIAFEKAENTVGQEMYAMIEGKLPEENAYVARTYKDAPSVDGFLFLKADRELMSGDFVKVKITGSNEYDLIGEMIDEFA